MALLLAAGSSLTHLRCLALALYLPLLSTCISAFPVPASSGEGELPDSGPEKPKYESLAELINHEAEELKKELCIKHFVCDTNTALLLENNLNLPRINKEDGCFKEGSQREPCLRKITTGLFGFHTYLSHLKEVLGEEKMKVHSLVSKTQQLKAALVLLMRKPSEKAETPRTQAALQTNPLSNEVWTKKVTARLILRDFISFIQATIRAVRFLNSQDLRNGSPIV